MNEMFKRDELKEIHQRALRVGLGINDHQWRRALLDLAYAADTLDAMLARARGDKDEAKKKSNDSESAPATPTPSS